MSRTTRFYHPSRPFVRYTRVRSTRRAEQAALDELVEHAAPRNRVRTRAKSRDAVPSYRECGAADIAAYREMPRSVERAFWRID